MRNCDGKVKFTSILWLELEYVGANTGGLLSRKSFSLKVPCALKCQTGRNVSHLNVTWTNTGVISSP